MSSKFEMPPSKAELDLYTEHFRDLINSEKFTDEALYLSLFTNNNQLAFDKETCKAKTRPLVFIDKEKIENPYISFDRAPTLEEF